MVNDGKRFLGNGVGTEKNCICCLGDWERRPELRHCVEA